METAFWQAKSTAGGVVNFGGIISIATTALTVITADGRKRRRHAGKAYDTREARVCVGGIHGFRVSSELQQDLLRLLLDVSPGRHFLQLVEHDVWPVSAKKVFALQFYEMCLSRIARNTTSWEIKTVLGGGVAIFEGLFETDLLITGVFSVLGLNLFKVHGNGRRESGDWMAAN